MGVAWTKSEISFGCRTYDFLLVFNDNEIDIHNNNRVIVIVALAPPPKGKWAWFGEILKSVLDVERMTFYMCSIITKSISPTITELLALNHYLSPFDLPWPWFWTLGSRDFKYDGRFWNPFIDLQLNFSTLESIFWRQVRKKLKKHVFPIIKTICLFWLEKGVIDPKRGWD